MLVNANEQSRRANGSLNRQVERSNNSKTFFVPNRALCLTPQRVATSGD